MLGTPPSSLGSSLAHDHGADVFGPANPGPGIGEGKSHHRRPLLQRHFEVLGHLGNQVGDEPHGEGPLRLGTDVGDLLPHSVGAAAVDAAEAAQAARQGDGGGQYPAAHDLGHRWGAALPNLYQSSH